MKQNGLFFPSQKETTNRVCCAVCENDVWNVYTVIQFSLPSRTSSRALLNIARKKERKKNFYRPNKKRRQTSGRLNPASDDGEEVNNKNTKESFFEEQEEREMPRGGALFKEGRKHEK